MRKKIIITIIRQHKTFYCYLLLSLWMFIIVICLYQYLGPISTESNYRPVSDKVGIVESQTSTNVWKSDSRFEKVIKSCAFTESITIGAEDEVPDGYSLEGIIIIFRHGDRGPINHVRNLDSVNCNLEENGNSTKTIAEFMSFMSTHWSNQLSNNLYQFYYTQQNNHPPVPKVKHCEIGQLTFQGVAQHLKLGHILKEVYFNRLFGNSTQIQTNIFAYTTKYRRTFQSLNAFLYGFLKEQFHKIILYVANSMYFCFEDCACPAIEYYNQEVIVENVARLKAHPAMIKLVGEIASFVFTMSDGSFAKDPHYIKDALLTYICHSAPLPCDSFTCVQPAQVTRVFSYIDWDIRQIAKSIRRHKQSLLNAYGFIKSITSHLLKIVSNEKPKVVLYSTHDKTLQHLLTAMGITTSDSLYPPYASRVIFEVYASKLTENKQTKKFYSRILFNGKDITSQIKFCQNKIHVASSKVTSAVVLCPFESLVRFLHDDYFSVFSAVNFKDACTLKN